MAPGGALAALIRMSRSRQRVPPRGGSMLWTRASSTPRASRHRGLHASATHLGSQLKTSAAGIAVSNCAPATRKKTQCSDREGLPTAVLKAAHTTSTINKQPHAIAASVSQHRRVSKQHKKDVHPTENARRRRGPEGRGRATSDPSPETAAARHARRRNEDADGPRRLRRGLLHGNEFWIRTLGLDKRRP